MVHMRPCSDADFDGVLMLLRQLWLDRPLNTHALRTSFNQALTSNSQDYLCATENGKIVGFGSLAIKNSLWQEGYLGHIDELVVDKTCRNRGIGTQLLESLIKLAYKKGCHRVELDSAFHRTQAHRFYEQHDFEKRAILFSKIL
jgi:glucosamine-phosphate N-acetyltransferase